MKVKIDALSLKYFIFLLLLGPSVTLCNDADPTQKNFQIKQKKAITLSKKPNQKSQLRKIASKDHALKLSVVQLFSEVLVDPDDLSEIGDTQVWEGWKARGPGLGLLSVWTREGNKGARKQQLVWAQAEETRGHPVLLKSVTEGAIPLTHEVQKIFEGISEKSIPWDGSFVGYEYIFDPLAIHSEGAPISFYLIRKLQKEGGAPQLRLAQLSEIGQAYVALGFDLNNRGLTTLGQAYLKKGISVVEILANEGNSDAQYQLGQFAEKGEVDEQDYAKAGSYYEQAAKTGNRHAQDLLKRPGFHEFVQAWKDAKLGNSPQSEQVLAKAYLCGNEWVTRDFKMASKWLNKHLEENKKAAEKPENVDLQYGLGVMYASGYEVARDETQAKDWLMKAESLGHAVAKEYLRNLRNPVENLNRKLAQYGIHVVALPGGVFRMGTPDTPEEKAKGRGDDEKVHYVKLKPFFIMDTKVTRKQWQAITGEDPGRRPYSILNWMSCEDCPMTQVDSNDSKKVIEKLKAKGITAILPTEAQQEYYMRGSYGGRKEITESTYPWDGAEKQLDDHACYINNAGRQGKKIQPVGSTKIPSNSYGIKDPLGNVLEWSMTAYSEYKNAPTVENAISDSEDPETSDGLIRVIRGCGWSNLAQHCRPAQRTKFNPDYSSDYLGLRFVVEP